MTRSDKITPDNIDQKLDENAPIHRGLGSKMWAIAIGAGLSPAALSKLFKMNYKTASKYYKVEKERRAKQKAEHEANLEALKNL